MLNELKVGTPIIVDFATKVGIKLNTPKVFYITHIYNLDRINAHSKADSSSVHSVSRDSISLATIDDEANYYREHIKMNKHIMKSCSEHYIHILQREIDNCRKESRMIKLNTYLSNG